MYTPLRKSFSTHWLQSTLAAALFLVPLASQADTFFGSGGLSNSATSTSNLAFGYQALFSNTSGNSNTATGDSAL